jgi:hypothetical protein
MKNYTIEFNGTGEVSEGHFGSDREAKSWVVSVLENLGYDASQLVEGHDWDDDGQNDDGKKCSRLLYWANEIDAENDPGARAICKLCKVG